MRSHVRSLLFAAVLLAIALVAGLFGFAFGAMGGVSVTVSGSSVTITNQGLPMHQAHIRISDGSTSIPLPVLDLPRGSTTITLPAPVKNYSGATIDGQRFGMGLTMYLSGPLPTGGSPVGEASASVTKVFSSDGTPGQGGGATTPAKPALPPGSPVQEATAPQPK
ncbi:MAG: hypothetical protein GC200_08080 [Tepidisphaera sp.]|nr:hypothetical protein [Tepidisphaera sp.]